jgi:hypothetical protein
MKPGTRQPQLLVGHFRYRWRRSLVLPCGNRAGFMCLVQPGDQKPEPRSDLQRPCSCCPHTVRSTIRRIPLKQAVAAGRSGCVHLQFPLPTGNPHYPQKNNHGTVEQSDPLLFYSSSFKELQSICIKHAALNAKAPEITAHSFFLFLLME